MEIKEITKKFFTNNQLSQEELMFSLTEYSKEFKNHELNQQELTALMQLAPLIQWQVVFDAFANKLNLDICTVYNKLGQVINVIVNDERK